MMTPLIMAWSSGFAFWVSITAIGQKRKSRAALCMGLSVFQMFMATTVHADQVITDVGLGAFGSKGASVSQDKFTKLGLQEEIWSPFQERFNLGGWIDDRSPGYSSAAFMGYQIGFEVTNDVLQGSVWTGPTMLTSTDQMLGGIFQFNETIFFGIVDKDKNSIGIAYNHFSSAGLETPNLGRDYLGLEIKCPF